MRTLMFNRAARTAGIAPTFIRAFSLISSKKTLTVSCRLSQLTQFNYRLFASKSSNFPAHTRINMPALSPTMTSGNIGQWHKKIGDEITPGDVLVEIETDKAQMDFECQEEGYLAQILMKDGSKDVNVNQPIAVLVENKEDVDAFANYTLENALSESSGSSSSASSAPEAAAAPESPAVAPSAPKETATAGSGAARVIASPVAKKIAGEKGVDLRGIQGSGPGNRIVKADVESAQPAVKKTTAPKQTAATPATSAATIGPNYTEVPLSNMRKVIANRLLESKTTIPHYYLTSDITMDKVLKLREVFNSQANSQYKLSVNDFIIKAAAMALRQVPEVNSGWTDEFIKKFNNVDISVAVSTPAGLITPIVSNADMRGLASISNTVRDLAMRARENKLAPHEYQGGSFTISNLGMFGVSEFSAIINPPQSCILAVGKTEKVVVPAAGEESTGFAVVSRMKVTLSCDHRVVDGAVGAQWLAKFKDYLENPLTLML